MKKHWYKDMHYAEFAEDESAALLAAIKDYEASKWKVIGQKVGKPAKVIMRPFAGGSSGTSLTRARHANNMPKSISATRREL